MEASLFAWEMCYPLQVRLLKPSIGYRGLPGLILNEYDKELGRVNTIAI
jgi:hypothetical protein